MTKNWIIIVASLIFAFQISCSKSTSDSDDSSKKDQSDNQEETKTSDEETQTTDDEQSHEADDETNMEDATDAEDTDTITESAEIPETSDSENADENEATEDSKETDETEDSKDSAESGEENISGIPKDELPGMSVKGKKLIETESGLQYYMINEGTGESPKPTDRVVTHYSGWDKEKKKFDSSKDRGQPATFPLNGVIKGWTEVLQLVKPGGAVKAIIPANLAYGECPSRGGRPCGVLIFDIELLEVK